MCVPSRLSSLERLEIPESVRENAMWLTRVIFRLVSTELLEGGFTLVPTSRKTLN
jgi:hypothetical protein